MNALQALDRARRAWERTSPQLVIDGWLDMLDEQETRALLLVEPARTHAPLTAHSPAGGLDSTSNGRCRISPKESRGSGREGA